MFAPPPPVTEHEFAQQAADDAQHYRAILQDLLDLGMQVARHVADAAVANPGPSAADALATATAFDRAARAVRRTIALARTLQNPAASPAEPGAEQKRADARRDIIRKVEDAIEQSAPRSERERLQAELQERLDGPDLDADIFRRPVPEIIGDICRDLGLANHPGLPAFRRRTPADIAALCARAGAPTNSNHASPPFRRASG